MKSGEVEPILGIWLMVRLRFQFGDQVTSMRRASPISISKFVSLLPAGRVNLITCCHLNEQMISCAGADGLMP